VPNLGEQENLIKDGDFSRAFERCPECGSRLRYDYEREEKFCPNCGATFAFDSVPSFAQVKSSHQMYYQRLELNGKHFYDRYSSREDRVDRIKHIVSAFIKCYGLPEYVFKHVEHRASEILSLLDEAEGERVRVSNVDIAFVAVSDVCTRFGLMDQKTIESWFETVYGEKFAGGLKAKSRIFKVAKDTPKDVFETSSAVTYVNAFVNRIVNSVEMLSLWRASFGVKGTEDEFRAFMAEVRVEAVKDVVNVKNVSPKNAAGVLIWKKMDELAKEKGIELMIGEDDILRLLGVDVRQRSKKVEEHMKSLSERKTWDQGVERVEV
jgi:hypothetical protein